MTATGSPKTAPSARARRTALIAAAGAAVMLGVAFAAKPLYDTFCRVTGFGGTTREASAPPGEVLARTMTVRFNASLARGAPFAFEPLQTSQEVEIGRRGFAVYRVTNISSRPVRAVATYNVTPHKVGPYFAKLECFCFQERVYAPGESVELPVLYFIDPAIAENDQLDEVRTVTLSYTYFETDDQGGIDVAEAPGGA